MPGQLSKTTAQDVVLVPQPSPAGAGLWVQGKPGRSSGFARFFLGIRRQALKFHRKRRLWSEFGQAAGFWKKARVTRKSGWMRLGHECCHRLVAVCLQARKCFRAAMQVRYGRWIKFLEAVLKGIFLKNCHSGLMRGLALRSCLRRAGFRCQQNNSGCVSKKLPGNSWSVGQTRCKNLVVAAVWVYRGSVVEVVKGEPPQAKRLERRSYCGSDRPARLKSCHPAFCGKSRATPPRVSAGC